MEVTANLQVMLLAAELGLSANSLRSVTFIKATAIDQVVPTTLPLDPGLGDLSTLPGTREQHTVKHLDGVELT